MQLAMSAATAHHEQQHRHVPASVCALERLTYLDLSYNNLTGAFPGAALYACAGLTFLDLSNNHFSGPSRATSTASRRRWRTSTSPSTNSFAAEVPPAVAWFPALRSLLLHNNSFTGGARTLRPR